MSQLETPTFSQLLKRPVQFLAFGMGSGLSPRAPGTAGTALAVLLYVPMTWLAPWIYLLVVIFAALVGVWLCEQASRQLNCHDHPGIVWDEFVGYWITMWALPSTWEWMLLGFIVFRVLDIVKPWPIGVLDKRVQGGLGIMVDDMVAGVMACALLHLLWWWL